MSAPFPTRYLVDGDDRTFLAYRTTTSFDDRVLLLLVEDSEDQHPFDVVSIHLDDPKLSVETNPRTSGGTLTKAGARSDEC